VGTSTTITLSTNTLTANTSTTTYKIRITPKSHANILAPQFNTSYYITAKVTGFTGSNVIQTKDDIAGTVITVDNIPPSPIDRTAFNWSRATTTQVGIGGNAFPIAIVYATGTFVAVGNGGFVMSSSDGITWTNRTAPGGNTNTWRGVAYGNGIFVAVSSDGTNRVMTSPDGITWTLRTAAAANSWNSVTYGNNLFVAVSSFATGNNVMTSPDGITWTSRTNASDNYWQYVTYGNGLFLAVAYSGINSSLVMTSPDGITWTSRTPANSMNNFYSVVYGNGLFVLTRWYYLDRTYGGFE
jgi:predicted RecA/RadA family phage recombinase